MPVVSLNRERLFKRLNKKYSDEEFEELLFQFGLELDDIIDDPELGTTSYKIEVGANRYDLLCLEGISLALNVYLQNCSLPKFQLAPSANSYKIHVKSATAQVRPYIVGAVLRGINFTQDIYDSFIDLQDKLHQNIARKRTLVAIGTHDLDTISGPFMYDARPPADITFVPLNRTQAYRSDRLLEMYMHDLHLREYVPIIKDKPVYPVITDRNGVVLSLPPIINGNHSKITLNTKNVFIECTATDKFKAQIVLDTLVCMFSGYCHKAYTVEPVQVEYESGISEQYPVLEYRTMPVDVSYCNSLVGIQESAEDIAVMLRSMCLESEATSSYELSVVVPPTRYDILHPCDVAEELAVAYGFDRLADDMQIPPTNTIAQENELNYHSDKLRLLVSQNNYTEAATFALVSTADLAAKMQLSLDQLPWVKVANPKSTECEAVRLSLLPGILKTVASNKHISLPLRIFELSDVAVCENNAGRTRGTGVRNERHLCAVSYNVKAGMEVVQGLLDIIMIALKIPHSDDGSLKGHYHLQPQTYSSYLPGFCGGVVVDGNEVGVLGILHPHVLAAFSLNNPVTALELNLQKLLNLEAQPL